MTDKAAPDTNRLRELAKAATSGPWTVEWTMNNGGSASEGYRVDLYAPSDRHAQLGRNKQDYEDAQFIAALSPAVVLSLLDRIEELEDQLRVRPFKPQPWDLVRCNCGSLDHVHQEWCVRAIAFHEALNPKP